MIIAGMGEVPLNGELLKDDDSSHRRLQVGSSEAEPHLARKSNHGYEIND
jgi:hypothetical protein